MHTLIEELKLHMKSTGTSQSAVAGACGISDATLSYWLKGKYQGNNEDVAAKVRDYLNTARLRQEMRGIVESDLVPTSIYNAVHEFCDVVGAHRKMGVITGKAGVGKTTALSAFVKKHPSAIFIEADLGYTADALFKDLCRILKITPKGCIHDKLMQVIDELKGSGRLIIVDEAEHFSYKIHELLRRVHDKAGVGITLVGLPRLYEKLKGESMYYEQLYTRIAADRKLGLLKDSDIHAVLDSRFKSVEESAFGEVVRSCKRIMRILSNLLDWCAEIMRKNGLEVLTAEVVQGATELLAVAR